MSTKQKQDHRRPVMLLAIVAILALTFASSLQALSRHTRTMEAVLRSAGLRPPMRLTEKMRAAMRP